MISLKAVEYSFIVALTVLQCFREAIIECQQHPGAKVEGLVLASLDKKILDREETTKGAFLWEYPNPDSCIQKRILRFFT